MVHVAGLQEGRFAGHGTKAILNTLWKRPDGNSVFQRSDFIAISFWAFI